MGSMRRSLRRRRFSGGKDVPGHIVSLQHQFNRLWVTRRGPDSTFSTTGPQVDADGNPVAHNYIPNSEGVGGAVGVLPTGWTMFSFTAPGLSASIVNVLVDGSIDVRFVGTSSSTYGYIIFGGYRDTSALPGQTFTGSAAFKLIAGSLPTRYLRIAGVNASYSTQEYTDLPLSIDDFSGNDKSVTMAFSNINTVKTLARLEFTWLSGTTVDFTIRISRPQLSKSAVKLPYVPTYGSAAFGPSITDKGLAAMGAWTQMLQNSKFEGAVSGTPGTTPTNWGVVNSHPTEVMAS